MSNDLKHTAIKNNFVENVPEAKQYMDIIENQRKINKDLMRMIKNQKFSSNKYINNIMKYLDTAADHIELLGNHIEQQQIEIEKMRKLLNNSVGFKS